MAIVVFVGVGFLLLCFSRVNARVIHNDLHSPGRKLQQPSQVYGVYGKLDLLHEEHAKPQPKSNSFQLDFKRMNDLHKNLPQPKEADADGNCREDNRSDDVLDSDEMRKQDHVPAKATPRLDFDEKVPPSRALPMPKTEEKNSCSQDNKEEHVDESKSAEDSVGLITEVLHDFLQGKSDQDKKRVLDVLCDD